MQSTTIACIEYLEYKNTTMFLYTGSLMASRLQEWTLSIAKQRQTAIEKFTIDVYDW